MYNFKHFIFGGEVFDKEKNMRVASNDLIIIEQEALVETRFIMVSVGSPNDPLVPRCAQTDANTQYKQSKVLV